MSQTIQRKSRVKYPHVTKAPGTKFGKNLNWLSLTIKIGSPIVVFAAWWIWSIQQSNPFFPSAPEVFQRFRELWLFEHFFTDILPSLGNLVVAFALSAVCGIVLGIVFALSNTISALLSPLINIYRAVPSVAVIPVFISLLGFGNEVSLIIIVLAAFPPVWIATIDGIHSVEPTLRDMAVSYRSGQLKTIVSLLLPGALPRIFSGLQVGLQFSFIVLIATEMLASSRGIGAMTILAQQNFASKDVWAGIFLLGIIGYISNGILMQIRKPLLRWYDRSQALQKAA